MQVKDLRSGKVLADRAERVTAIAWATDNKTIFYVQEDPVSKRSHKAFRHTLGGTTDELLHEEKDELYDIYLHRTRSGAYVIMGASSSTTSEMWMLAANQPAGTFKTIAGRKDGREYYVDHTGDHFYIMTNDTGRNFRLVMASVSDPGSVWTEVIPHRDDVKIEDIDCFKDYYVTSARENGVPTFRVTELAGRTSHAITFPEPVYVADGTSNTEFDTHKFGLYTSRS